MTMEHQENLNAASSHDASVVRGAMLREDAEAHGVFIAECFDKDGNLKWRDTIDNVVCTEEIIVGAAVYAAVSANAASASGTSPRPPKRKRVYLTGSQADVRIAGVLPGIVLHGKRTLPRIAGRMSSVHMIGGRSAVRLDA